jgi:uncharacterized protein (TIGR04255 family)
MTERPSDLPNYRKPPVDEVVIGVQFPAIEGLQDGQIREFWKMVRDAYPILERQPRIEGPIESLRPQPLLIQFPSSVTVQAQGRTWMINDNDDFLIQIQNDRFIQNWRRRQDEYGHFDDTRDRFWTNFSKFREFLNTQGLSQPTLQQVEVTYFDWIPELPMSGFLLPATATVIHISGTDHMPEEQSWSARYLIENTIGAVQRLYVQAAPAVRPLTPEVRGTQLGFIFRVARESGFTDDEIAALVNTGRAIVVEAFTQLTTSSAHQLWERYK